MHNLEKRIKKAREENRLAIIPFITAGFPEKEKFWKILEEIDQGGADIIEIGVPFSDPVADGPVVEEASRRVLENGMNLRQIIMGLKARKDKLKAGIVLMGYMNPFLQYGFEKLATDAKAVGVEGIIIPDLPYEENEKFRKILKKEDIALIPLIGLNTSSERMKLYAENSEGYVYAVSVMGITGERKKLSEGIERMIKEIRQHFSIPVALGFGLRHPDQLKELADNSLPDAAVFGSALLTHIDSGQDINLFIKPWLNPEKYVRQI